MVEPTQQPAPSPEVFAAPPSMGRTMGRKLGLYLGLVDEKPTRDAPPSHGWLTTLFAVGMTILVLWCGFAAYAHLIHGRDWSRAFGSAFVPALAVGVTELLVSALTSLRGRFIRLR